ncbi:hypothetical protein ACFU99_32345 [Streptomyces sp. NPDC057654]|uniref:hypothetical protein n=1 Tax=Streptomyces sp. NPDC057654 TaxID=3346196 RepID=UPI0036A584AA
MFYRINRECSTDDLSFVAEAECGDDMVRDTRLVQTAVIGDEQSDVPIILPTEAIELDVFRRAHQQDTFWCGLLLGGCGGQLGHKLYTDRQCHFQHNPLPHGAPNACRRPSVGESSADHLYVKSAMSRSLLEYGRAARFAFPPPIGSLVDVDLEDGLSLRIHMDASVQPDWARQHAVILGPGAVPDPDILAGCPYVYRVRCDSDGATRRVWIGTQSLASPTEWVPFSECTWTDEGLLTPAASRFLRDRPTARARADAPGASSGRGNLPESVVTFARGLEAAQRTGTVDHVRRLCDGSSTFLENLTATARAEAERVLEEAKAWVAAHEEYQRRIFKDLDAAVRERRAWDVRSGVQQAASLTRRGASAEEHRILATARTYLRGRDYAEQSPAQAAGRRQPHHKPVPAPKKPAPPKSKKQNPNRPRESAAKVRTLLKRLRRESDRLAADELTQLTRELKQEANIAAPFLRGSELDQIDSWIRWARRRRPRRATAAQPRVRTKPPAARKPPSPARVKLDPLAAAVKTVLQRAASTGTTLTWRELRAQLPPELPALERSRQVDVLIQVDQSCDRTAPLLSALVTGSDRDMHPAFPRIAAAAGRPRPGRDLAAVAQWVVEVSRFHRDRTK